MTELNLGYSVWRNMTGQGESESDRLCAQLPKLRGGFVIAISIFVLEIVAGVQKGLANGTPQERSAGGYALALAVIADVMATAYVLSSISTFHSIVNDVKGWSHPISPKRAVRFHFIPFFNIYWNFKWPVEMAKFVNWRTQTHRMSGVLVGALVLAGFLVAGFVEVSVGLVIVLSAFAYISRCLRAALAAAPVPADFQIADDSNARYLETSAH
ncbi:MAG: hypothetical protein LAN70_11950 [Acidobacteriia bacterium]|nr:hypothetical protein [Terriglobia bacterium]